MFSKMFDKFLFMAEKHALKGEIIALFVKYFCLGKFHGVLAPFSCNVLLTTTFLLIAFKPAIKSFFSSTTNFLTILDGWEIL